MRDSQLRYGPSRIDVTQIQPVEMPTLTASRAVWNCSTLVEVPTYLHQPEWRKGSAMAVESISLATFWGRYD
jgi:hypothetical protein